MDEEGKIVLIGNESDVLHCGYSHAISDAGKRYPSAVHYTHSTILSRLGVEDNVILELLGTSSCDVPAKARELLIANMPTGHDLESLSDFLERGKQSYTMIGLRLRVEQDKSFEKALMNTKEAMLIVCDPRDREFGIGLDDNQFVDFMRKENATAHQISHWMSNEADRPSCIGQNQLGHYLMWLRYEIKEKRKLAMLSSESYEVDGLSTDNDDNPIKIKVNDLVISLQGIFRPLSNYYPLPFEMKGERYRSVEHYAYEKLFNVLKLDDKMIEKIQTTVLPIDVPIVATKVFKKLELDDAVLESKMAKMDRWRQSAMKHKITRHDYLQQLLLSTGDALLIDTADGEPMWTCGCSEQELQRLLTKSYVNPTQLVDWMRDKDGKTPKSLMEMKGNKIGLLLMELRVKLASQTLSRIPLISNLTTNFSTMVSPHVICLTAESVWHFLYPAELRVAADQPLIPSPAHYVAQQAVRYLGFNEEDSECVLNTKSSLECWQNLHIMIEAKGRGLEREQSWWMDRRQKAIKEALQLLFEQHPPLLRALLETGDALLVYCARFCSIETELSIGMRESDLRWWMHTTDVGSKQLIELCTRPLAFRPPYLGGNRLGLILMELRREYVLRGVCPANLPCLPIGVDAILGTDSPAENMSVSENFDILSPENYYSLWINPFMILAKQKKYEHLAPAAYWVKYPPRLFTVDEDKISEQLSQLLLKQGRVSARDVGEVAPEDLRAIFIRLCSKLREKVSEIETQQAEMNVMAAEVKRMQTLRHGLEETRERDRDRQRAAAGKDREDRTKEERSSPIPSSIQQLPQRREREYKIPNRRKSPTLFDEQWKPPARKEPFTLLQRTRSPTLNKSPPRKKPPTPPSQPKPPKAPRPADEELSEGEILSSDED